MRDNHQWNKKQLEQLRELLSVSLTDGEAEQETGPSERNRGKLGHELFKSDKHSNKSPLLGYGPISLGSIPSALNTQPAMLRTFRENNPVLNLSRIYWKPGSGVSPLTSIECRKTDEQRRTLLHDTLQHWIRFADEHQIWWCLSYGSLIGSLRDGNIIPYDSDMDIFILGSQESKLRHLATNRWWIRRGKFNLITRPGPFCSRGPGERANCYGIKVAKLSDMCAFCGPFARVFMDYGKYIDLFSIHLELHTNKEGKPVKFGFVLEGQTDRNLVEWPLLIPLSRCQILGLEVPCPQQSHRLLEKLYGTDWRKPRRVCNGLTGEWEGI
ncbi:unnamed protein product [Echinostoma caproni]|uniref:LicD/FKTN/FKRP nucleotidyltransferase domain-containing protein n=1 Tax=Echinostoma caproni TaxID=27848 RepID=A0A183AAP6_9TREM|nr:unnamed protein product [Echinostoma caproni]